MIAYLETELMKRRISCNRCTGLILTGIAVFSAVGQVACVPADAQSSSDFASSAAMDVLNQTVNFVLSFARNALAAFLF
jgi:hypothetical protein